jgi:hypothetical protein
MGGYVASMEVNRNAYNALVTKSAVIKDDMGR